MSDSTVIIDNIEYERNTVRLIPCATWENFRAEVTKVRTLKTDENSSEIGRSAIFRGHSESEWKLSSKLERAFVSPAGMMDGHGNPVVPNFKKAASNWYEKIQEKLLARFTALAVGKDGVDLNMSQNELWALGRHYGLITPFLDWSESPYVAAFFSLLDTFKLLEFKIVPIPLFTIAGDVHIWGLRRWKGLEIDGEFEIVTPSKPFGSRLWAQAGVFTRLSSNDHLDVQSYLESRGIAHYLECYVLSIECAATAISDLKLMNISFSTLFPDLHGAAMEANQNEVLLHVSQLQSALIKADSAIIDSDI